MAYLRLIRLPNLLIVALTQFLLLHQIILPAFQLHGISRLLDPLHFFLLVIVTMIITAGGYIVNDITDFKIDLVNKPTEVLVHKHIPVQTAYWLYFCLNLIGFIFALYLAFSVENIPLVNIFVLAVIGLYAYSSWMKKRPIIGNLVVAMYCAMVAGIVWFAERGGIDQLKSEAPKLATQINLIVLLYMGFAFLSTVFREIVKDIEDLKGDLQANRQTIPIKYGEKKARFWASLTGYILLIFISFMAYRLAVPLFTLLLILVILVAPLIYALYLLKKSKTVQDFHYLSQVTKIIMVSGILILLFLNP